MLFSTNSLLKVEVLLHRPSLIAEFEMPSQLWYPGNSAEPVVSGLGPPPGASPSPSIPLEPKALLGIPHTIFKQSLSPRSQCSLALYLYSEALVRPSQCCFNSCYCCFSIYRVLCLLSLTCSFLFMGHGTHPWTTFLCCTGRWRWIE